MRNKKIIDDDSLLSMQEENIKKNAGKGGKRKLMTTAVVLLLVAGVTVPTAIYLEKRNVSVDIDPNIEILEEYTINVRRGTYIKDLTLQKIEGYTFIGFYKDAELTKPYNENDRLTKDTTIYAKYEINIYTLSFPTGPAFTIEGDGIEDNQVELEYNSEYSFKPTLNPGYEDVDIAVRINDEILTPNQDGYYTIKIDEDTAVYIDGVEINSYSVTFYDSVEKNELYQTQDIKYYELCTYSGVTPTKHSTPIYEYTFIGWMDSDGETVDLSTTHIVCDLELFANFSEEYIEYTITKPEQVNVKFQDLYLSNSATLHYGDIVEITYDTTEGYRVTSFNVSGAEKIEGSENQYRITGNLEIIYEEVIQTFTIQILSNNEDYGKVNASSITVDYGTEIKVSRSTISIGAITITATPTTNNAQYSYSFDGWDTGSVTVTQDLTITATFTQTVNTYTVTWLNWDGSTLEIDKNIPYGTMPEYNGETPSRENTETTLYEYIGWDETVSVVTGDVTYTAVFEETSLVLPYEVNENGEITNYTGTATEIEIPATYSLSSDDTPIYGTDIAIIGIADASSSSAGAFANKEITSVTIPEGFGKIGAYAFYGCTNLVSVYIPTSVTEFGNNSFSGCNNLEDVYYSGDVNAWVSLPFSYNGNNPLMNGANLYVNGDTLLTDANIDTATSISYGAFRNCESIVNVTIGDQVLSMGNSAFYNCENLETVVIGNSVPTIGNATFCACSRLREITIPKSVTSIESLAFGDCERLNVYYSGDINDWVKINFGGNENPLSAAGNLYVNGDELVTDANIDTSTYINASAFSGYDKLTSITLGAQVYRIGEYAFLNCTNLENIYYASDINDWVSISFGDDSANPLSNGANLYINGNELVTEANIDIATSIGDFAFYNYDKLTSAIIGNQVTRMGDKVFRDCSILSNVKIGNKVSSIGEDTFKDCINITSLDIPSSVKSIGDGAFSGCYHLASISIPSSVTSIGSHAFYSCCSLTSVILPRINNLGIATFWGCSSLISIDIPSSVTSIDRSVFYNCSSLTSVIIPSSVTSIDDGVFSGCYSLVYVVNKSSLEFNAGDYGTSSNWELLEIVSDESDMNLIELNGNLYKDYNGERYFIKNVDGSMEIEIDPTCDQIYQYAFDKGNYTSFGWADNNQIINGNDILTITIPSSVTAIGNNAFLNCYSLAYVVNKSSVAFARGDYGTSSGDNPILEIVSDEADVVFVDIGGNLYKDYNDVRYFVKNLDGSSEIVVDSSCDQIYQYAFYLRNDITSVTFPEGLTTIGEGAFSYCTSLTSLTIPNSVTSITSGAFEGCANISTVYLGSGVRYMNSDAFLGCGIKDVYFAGTVENWMSITFSSNVYGNPIYGGANLYVNGNELLTEVDTSRRRINFGTFYNNKNITHVTIRSGVSSIERSAFWKCTNLKYVTIESSSVYRDADGTGYDDCGALLESALEVRVLISCIEDSTNSYLENASNFTKTTSEDGLYYIYNKI